MMTKDNGKASVATAETIHIMGSLDKGLDSVDKALGAGKGQLVLDFTACTFISVDGLEWLEELLLRANSGKRPVRFVNVPPPIYKVFKVSHIESLIEAAGGAGRASNGPVC
ncbi:MAG: STAS domain-containing protein [Candidatus Obscuribacter sp.]|jgi:anti-anti-sigma regulatory factor|nr:STAS domain-containing protein [Candidatus Obscuribacter sp.]MBP6592760.1 STAS domain-containing protein [Candidatus Obscuribacter sp.]